MGYFGLKRIQGAVNGHLESLPDIIFSETFLGLKYRAYEEAFQFFLLWQEFFQELFYKVKKIATSFYKIRISPVVCILMFICRGKKMAHRKTKILENLSKTRMAK